MLTDASREYSAGRVCAWCSGDVPPQARSDSKFCGVVCRKRSHRFTTAVLEQGPAPVFATERAFAYADPPYPGKADYYTGKPTYGGEVSYYDLIGRLVDDYPDGWALSTSAESLQSVLRMCPPGVRVCSWHRRVRHVRAKRPLQGWEPLLVYGGREYPADRTQLVVDRLTCEARYGSYPGALVGMKPPEFAVWLFRQLGAGLGDRLEDLYPGSGAIGRAWGIWTGEVRTTTPRILSVR